MIHSFRCEETKKVFEGKRSRELPGNLQSVIQRKLKMLDAAKVLQDLRVPPGNRLEALKGGRDGQYSIRINDQWRLCFEWDEGAFEVEIIDYH